MAFKPSQVRKSTVYSGAAEASAPGEACAEGREQEVVALLDATRTAQRVERDTHRGRRGVAVFFEHGDDASLVGRKAQPARNLGQQVRVGLMWNHPAHVIRRELVALKHGLTRGDDLS